MSEQSLVIGTKSAVSPWATRPDVREMIERIKTMLPGGQKLSGVEVAGLAQAALAHNLDPFNGEIWCLPGKGLMAGIKGHRRAAHEQINREANGSGNYYVEFYVLNIDEMTLYKIPRRALAFRARLHDSQTTRTYVENIERLLKAGMPWEIVSKIMGDQPFNDGIGYAMPDHPDSDCKACHGTGTIMNKWGKQVNCECFEESKMSMVQRAQKRAEAEALKRRFDLPFTMAIGVNGDADVIDAEFAVHPESVPERDTAEAQAKMQAASAALRGDQEDGLGPQWPAEPEASAAPESKAPATTANSKTTQPSDDNGKVKPAVNKCPAFTAWCNALVATDARAAKYGKAEDPRVANMPHVIMRIAKLGYAEITEANHSQVEAAFKAYIEKAEA